MFCASFEPNDLQNQMIFDLSQLNYPFHNSNRTESGSILWFSDSLELQYDLWQGTAIVWGKIHSHNNLVKLIDIFSETWISFTRGSKHTFKPHICHWRSEKSRTGNTFIFEAIIFAFPFFIARFSFTLSSGKMATKAEKWEINWKIYFQCFYDERIIFYAVFTAFKLACFSASEV